ncbi:TPA: phage antirepressor N-terminal domain-containing protein [Klebsiella pneumoniae]|nr:phage antirepressor N-terminal domain-containing protein [Klebsiella pneumoniae]
MGNVTPRIKDFTINVPFYGSELYVVNHDGEPYTPMKPIVDGMGMDWASQFTKMKQRFKSTVVEITMVAGDGKSRRMICLALRKLAAWLNTISPNKVRPEIRERVIRYQEECDDVLYDYWTKGQAVNPRKSETTADERTPLRALVNRIMGKTGIHYQPLYKMIHREFGVNHIDELTPKQVAEAMEYLAGKVLEGELLPKDNNPIPFSPAMPSRGAGRTMLYIDEKGVVQGSYPLAEDQVVMSFDGFVNYFRKKGWIVSPRDEVAKGLLGAVDSLQ